MKYIINPSVGIEKKSCSIDCSTASCIGQCPKAQDCGIF